MPEVTALVQLLTRWFHIFFGIVWIGHLYFFNFVNVPSRACWRKSSSRRSTRPSS